MTRRLHWRFWVCPLAAGMVASAMGVKLPSWQWLGAVALFILGSIDRDIDP